MFRRSYLAVALIAATAIPVALSAQTVTPSNTHGWASDPGHTQGGGTAAISSDQPHDVNGSLEFSTPNSSAASAYTLTFPSVALSTFSSASFDWYRDASSTVAAHFTPVYTFDIAYNDMSTGNPIATYGQLEWEGVYNGINTATTDAWQHTDITDGLFWAQGGLYGVDRGPLNTTCGDTEMGGAQLFQSISDWISSSCLNDAMVYGVTVQVGSGWDGTFLGDVDNVAFDFNDGPSGDYNFETDGGASVTPEPASMSLMAMGLVGMVGAGYKRRRRKV